MSDDAGRLGLLGCSHLTAKVADVVERIMMCNEYRGLDRESWTAPSPSGSTSPPGSPGTGVGHYQILEPFRFTGFGVRVWGDGTNGQVENS
jgi:hypothetical protein